MNIHYPGQAPTLSLMCTCSCFHNMYIPGKTPMQTMLNLLITCDHCLVYMSLQLGTLGAGNHYAEIQVVEEIYDGLAATRMGIEEKGQVSGLH